MKVITTLDQDFLCFLQKIRGGDIKTQAPKILKFIEEKCQFGVNLKQVQIKYVKTGTFWGCYYPVNYKGQNEKITMKINMGIHRNIEQLCDTVVHEY